MNPPKAQRQTLNQGYQERKHQAQEWVRDALKVSADPKRLDARTLERAIAKAFLMLDKRIGELAYSPEEADGMGGQCDRILATLVNALAVDGVPGFRRVYDEYCQASYGKDTETDKDFLTLADACIHALNSELKIDLSLGYRDKNKKAGRAKRNGVYSSNCGERER